MTQVRMMLGKVAAVATNSTVPTGEVYVFSYLHRATCGQKCGNQYGADCSEGMTQMVFD